jgi:3-phenylpropionate/trans-cinnamate dioxygenase ferredoxin reductase subunit
VRPASWYAEQRIDLHLDCAVEALDPAQKSLSLSDGTRLRYAKLALTTGARPRRLPPEIGGDLVGVFTIRGVADADAIAPLLGPGKRMLVVGGGYIGLEAAAVAAISGLQVTIIEVAERILQRVAAPPTANYFRALHRKHGVTILESTALARLTGTGGRLTGVELGDGTRLPADLAIVGIGILPNDEGARAAGLAVDNGILVDGQCHTSAPDIYAAGDCARFRWRGELIRLESVQNAIDHAEHAAAAMLGEQRDYDPVPWFWSDQYDVKLQIAGLNRGYTDCILRPGRREGAGSVWYCRDDVMIAVDAMNDALAYGIGKKLLDARRPVPASKIRDLNFDLKTLV